MTCAEFARINRYGMCDPQTERFKQTLKYFARLCLLSDRFQIDWLFKYIGLTMLRF